jgi:hypothetical protein
MRMQSEFGVAPNHAKSMTLDESMQATNGHPFNALHFCIELQDKKRVETRPHSYQCHP